MKQSDAIVEAILDLQPLGMSQNDPTRIWQMYPTPEDAAFTIKVAVEYAMMKDDSRKELTKQIDSLLLSSDSIRDLLKRLVDIYMNER